MELISVRSTSVLLRQNVDFQKASDDIKVMLHGRKPLIQHLNQMTQIVANHFHFCGLPHGIVFQETRSAGTSRPKQTHYKNNPHLTRTRTP